MNKDEALKKRLEKYENELPTTEEYEKQLNKELKKIPNSKENKSNISPNEIISDIEKWVNRIDANVLLIKSSLITIKAWLKEEQK